MRLLTSYKFYKQIKDDETDAEAIEWFKDFLHRMTIAKNAEKLIIELNSIGQL